MKVQTKPLEVLERTAHYLKAGVINQTPAWFNVVGANPPVKNLARQPNFKYRKNVNLEQTLLQTKEDAKKQRKNRMENNFLQYDSDTQFYQTRIRKQKDDIYKPIKLKYLEDELRNLFYRQHPWELADPKVIIENNGNDIFKQDWSSIIQLNKKLDGESVVQRTLYLLKENKEALENGKTDQKLSLKSAYDQARFEYYQVKMQRELESQIATEEATLNGAIFKTSAIEFGFAKEQQVIEQWRSDAIIAEKKLEASKTSASFGNSEDAEDSAEAEAFDETIDEAELETSQNSR